MLNKTVSTESIGNSETDLQSFKTTLKGVFLTFLNFLKKYFFRF